METNHFHQIFSILNRLQAIAEKEFHFENKNIVQCNFTNYETAKCIDIVFVNGYSALFSFCINSLKGDELSEDFLLQKFREALKQWIAERYLYTYTSIRCNIERDLGSNEVLIALQHGNEKKIVCKSELKPCIY